MSPSARAGGLSTPLARFASPRMALILGGVSVLVFAASFVLSPLAHQGLTQYFWLLPYSLVGVVIAWRQPRNPIGWIVLATGLVTMFCSDAGIYAVVVYRSGRTGLPLGRPAVALAAFWVAFVLLLPLPILLFPDGRVPAGRWRFAAWAYFALCALVLVGSGIVDAALITAHRLRIDSSGELTAFDGGGPASAVAALVYVCLSLSFVVRLVISYRKSAGERRAQLKWLMSGTVYTIVGFIVGISLHSVQSGPVHILGFVAFLGVFALPLSIAVAVLKYRLYDIDRLISRTLSYAILTTLLVGTFVGLVALSTDLLAFSSSVGVAASTLAAAALFNPLRHRVQHVVDRRFNRTRYDAEATVAAFAARLRDAIDLDTVQAELLEVVQRAVEPTTATIWIRGRSE